MANENIVYEAEEVYMENNYVSRPPTRRAQGAFNVLQLVIANVEQVENENPTPREAEGENGYIENLYMSRPPTRRNQGVATMLQPVIGNVWSEAEEIVEAILQPPQLQALLAVELNEEISDTPSEDEMEQEEGENWQNHDAANVFQPVIENVWSEAEELVEGVLQQSLPEALPVEESNSESPDTASEIESADGSLEFSDTSSDEDGF
jgi:hypothetical protein